MTNTRSTSKVFMSYDEQVAKLRSKNLCVDDEVFLRKLLKEISYFALISGYKKPFKNTESNYKQHTTINDILALYTFDNNLRSLFFRYILKIENHIKSLISYSFCNVYGELQDKYLNTSSYNYSLENQQGITKLISKLYALVINPEKYPYLLHQKNHYNNVPLWATTKALTLGTVSKMYSFLPQHIQTAISKEFPFVNKTMLEKMLDILTLTRNVCAHNERLFDHIFMKSSIYDTAVHANLKIPKRKSLYRKGKKDLFAVVITFKYLLEKEDFDTFCDELEGLIETLKKQTNQIQQAQIYKDMGFPDNWKDIRNI